MIMIKAEIKKHTVTNEENGRTDSQTWDFPSASSRTAHDWHLSPFKECVRGSVVSPAQKIAWNLSIMPQQYYTNATAEQGNIA
jgi:hypothetical protein